MPSGGVHPINPCGALNDNLAKNATVVLAIYTLGIGGAGLSALAGALFIAPYVLLSATAGSIADRLSKPRVIAAYKAAEVVLMAAAATAFLAQSVPGLLAVLFGLGVQAALLGPVNTACCRSCCARTSSSPATASSRQPRSCRS
jgi:acyl-[acyl-carrier-protein]-phospholipid O-acyltransferase / long-chain-fatty-acid--[acyl-carrier-protein] ligase